MIWNKKPEPTLWLEKNQSLPFEKPFELENPGVTSSYLLTLENF